MGLVLVCGPTGSGKTTLQAAVYAHAGEVMPDRKVITYEDPVEFVLGGIHWKGPQPAQSQIGRDIQNFACGLRNAMRRKPSIIGIGEARDLETVDAMVEAGLTGHLCYVTVHTESVAETINRIIQVYLSRYTHRVAISNQRLVAMDERGVTFRWKDYRAKEAMHKTMTLDVGEFMRRFLLHVLPTGHLSALWCADGDHRHLLADPPDSCASTTPRCAAMNDFAPTICSHELRPDCRSRPMRGRVAYRIKKARLQATDRGPPASSRTLKVTWGLSTPDRTPQSAHTKATTPFKSP